MSTKIQMRALLGMGALALASASWGCVADRPSRNGVFDENQYIRKDFLVRPGDSTVPDAGWLVEATITTASEPNVFGDNSYFGLTAGSHSSGALVHFDITNDKLSLLNSREISPTTTTAQGTGRQPEVINAWAATNVDLKYRVNLDGEKTNFYEENQELDWQQRQWVKVNLDKNDMSDLAPLGQYYNAAVAKCADEANASATLVTNSFVIDETNNYMQWAVQVTLPIKFDDADCMTAMGQNGQSAQRLGREYQTATIQYSFMRAEAAPTYAPLALGEHDSIRRKYGVITYTDVATDTSTGLLGANEYATRYDPTKPIDWYFEEGFPDQYKNIFTNNVPSGVPVLPSTTPTIEDATNTLFMNAGVAARVKFHEWNEADAIGNTNHTFGDIRYNVLRFIQTFNQQTDDAGVTSSVIDPRNGQIISQSIVFSNFAIQDYYIARIDAYLQTVGASAGIQNDWPVNPTSPLDPNPSAPTIFLTCSADYVGAAAPLIPATVAANHNGTSTLYQKMQGYLYKPSNTFGPLGPADFIAPHQSQSDPTQPDMDFYHAYFTYVPYLIFADPSLNQFVTPEGGNSATDQSTEIWNMVSTETQFHALTTSIDQGISPYASSADSGSMAAVTFNNQLKAMAINHRNLQMSKTSLAFSGADLPVAHYDSVTDFALQSVMQRDARHCIADGQGGYHWETKTEWQNSLIYTYWSQVAWHEFGHALGLEHNFMGSIDQLNFPTYTYKDPTTNQTVTRPTLYSSSVMEYNAPADRVFWGAGWGPYDQGAIGFLYTNNSSTDNTSGAPSGTTQQTQSGQYSPTYPWNDPNGFKSDGKTEIQFFNCNETHVKYTPLCRAGDLGATPSEITANEIDNYEWQYTWRNFRQYHKFWDLTNYGDDTLELMTDQRRFLSLWTFDFGSNEIASRLQQYGITVPAGAPSLQTYFNQLTDKFTNEMSASGQLSASFQEAIIQQSAGQRPFITTYDNFFGDVTQQGINLDKLFALQSFLALWPIDNYDPTQSQGLYGFANSPYGLADDINGVANGTSYGTVAEQATESMLGSFDSFAYFKETAVAQYTWDTHSDDFAAETQSPVNQAVQDWVGSKSFTRVEDFLMYFQEIATEHNFSTTLGDFPINCNVEVTTGEDYQACNYDPRTPRGIPGQTWYSDADNEFVAPDGRNYIWLYIQDRNEWVIADKDRNVATYQIMKTYNEDVLSGYDDGTLPGLAYQDLIQVKYFVDYYNLAVNTSH